ncbi:MAG: helix-turn-helix transcriptional regulator [Capsulimonadales bacterium]|nr:helix-turn-helix transcriptional regulator [Capsulimonadales bacterium]
MDFRGDLDALILGVLQQDALHGYEISRRINQSSQGDAIRVKESQLYPVLHRLEAEGRITADWIPQEGKPARKVYRLTDEGRRALAAKQANWARFTASVNALLFPTREVRNG